MSNRYTNLSFNSLRDLPQLTLPYNEMNDLLMQKQGEIDLTKQMSDLRPDYITDSPSDRALASQLTQYQQSVKEQLAQLAAKGNVNDYMSGLSQAQNQIKSLYQPGGAADILKQRKLQAEAEDKRLDEQYKDNPTWADYYKKNRQYNEVGYNPATGEYKPLSSLGQTTKYVDPKEITTFANTYLDNIKDTLLLDDKGQPITGKDKIYLDSITNVYDLYNLKGVTKDRIINAMAKVLPDEYKESMYTQYEIDRFYNPNIKPLDKRITIKENGKEILNPDNPVARQLEGWAEIGVRVNKDGQKIKVTNEKALAKYKHDLDNPYTPPTSGYTNAVTNPYMQDFHPIEIKDGVIKEKNQDRETAETKKKTLASKIDEMRRNRVSEENIQKYIKEEEAKITELEGGFTDRKQALFSTIKEKNSNLTDAQVAKVYNDVIDDRKSSAIIYERINDPKVLKNTNDRVLGSEKKIVNIGVRPVYFLDSDGNISKPTNAQGAIDRLGVENLDKGIEGRISADNPLGLPTGDYATAIDKNGKFVTMVIGNRSIEEDQHFAPLNQLSKPKYSLTPEVVTIGNDVYTSEPVIDVDEDGNYRGISAKITVEKYDEYGNQIGEPKQWSLDQVKQSFNQNNPYK